MRRKVGDFGQMIPETAGVTFRIDGIRCKMSEQGNMSVFCDCGVVSPPGLANRPLSLRFTLSMASAWISGPWLKAMGLTEDEQIDDTDTTFTESILKNRCVGNLCKADIIIQEREGYAPRNEIDPPNMIEAAGKGEKPAEKDDEIPF